MGQQSGAKNSQPPAMQGQAMNMQQGWGGGWGNPNWQVPYAMNPQQGQVGGNMPPPGYQGGPGSGGGVNPPPAQGGNLDAGHQRNFDQLMAQDPFLARQYAEMDPGAADWYRRNQLQIAQKHFGATDDWVKNGSGAGGWQPMNQWINDNSAGGGTWSNRGGNALDVRDPAGYKQIRDMYAGLQQGAAPAGGNSVPAPPAVGSVAQPAVGAMNQETVQGSTAPWQKNRQPPQMLGGAGGSAKGAMPPQGAYPVREQRWRGLAAGGKPAMRPMAEILNTPVTN